MDIFVEFPGGARVDAHAGLFTVHTDQPVHAGGEDSAPTPFTIFLASIGACAGIYVLNFCRKRGISTEGLRLVERIEMDQHTGKVSRIGLDLQLPPDFPEKYRLAVVRAAEQCAVKKHFESPPQIEISAVIDSVFA